MAGACEIKINHGATKSNIRWIIDGWVIKMPVFKPGLICHTYSFLWIFVFFR